MAAFSHETNTFAIEHNDAMDKVHIQSGRELLECAHPKSFIGGFADAALKSVVELVPCIGIRFAHGGLIHAGVFEQCTSSIVQSLSEKKPLDGIYLALHGADVAADPHTDAEGDLVRAIPDVFQNIPIVATYDFQAIMTEYEATSLVPFPNYTNPHIDGYERGVEACGCLIRMLCGEIHPVTSRVLVPIIGPNIGQSTWSHLPGQEARLPLYKLNVKREEIETRPGVLNVTILGGYGYGDSPDLGMSILATTDNDPELADRVARELALALWNMREELLTVQPVHDIDKAVETAMLRDEGPVLLVDLGDDPDSACSADSPAVLESLIRQNASDCVLKIRDAEAVRVGMETGVGNSLTMDVGGNINQRFYSPDV